MSNSVSVITNGLYLAAYWLISTQVVNGQFDTQVLTQAINQPDLGIK